MNEKIAALNKPLQVKHRLQYIYDWIDKGVKESECDVFAPNMLNSEIAEMFDSEDKFRVDQSTVSKDLTLLEAIGLIEKLGHKRLSYTILNSQVTSKSLAKTNTMSTTKCNCKVDSSNIESILERIKALEQEIFTPIYYADIEQIKYWALQLLYGAKNLRLGDKADNTDYAEFNNAMKHISHAYPTIKEINDINVAKLVFEFAKVQFEHYLSRYKKNFKYVLAQEKQAYIDSTNKTLHSYEMLLTTTYSETGKKQQLMDTIRSSFSEELITTCEKANDTKISNMSVEQLSATITVLLDYQQAELKKINVEEV